MNYQPGKSLLIYATGVLNPQGNNESNVSTFIGYFDDENGVYFKHNNGKLYVSIRSNTSGTVENREVIQTEWNIDTMDGSGPSGIILDASKTQILYMDIEWLGVGTVRTGVIIDGQYYLVHKFHHANNRENVYMTTPNLPLRYEINAIGNSNTQGSLMEICGTIISEGGFTPTGLNFSATNTSLVSMPKNTERALVAIRLKEEFKRAYNSLRAFQVLLTTTNNLVIYKLRKYRNVNNITNLFSSGYTFTSVSDDSIMEYTLNPTFNTIDVFDNNIILEGFATSQTPELNNHHQGLFLSSNITGSRDIMVLTATSLNDNNIELLGTISWIEHI